MTQGALAEAVGVHRQAVSGWERGLHVPTARNFEDIARALGTSVQSLRDGEPPTLYESKDLRRPARVREGEVAPERATVRSAPRVPPAAYQLIYEYTTLLEDAGVPEIAIDEARRLMSGETFNTLNSGAIGVRDEAGWLKDVKAAWAFIKDTLRAQGFDL